MVLECWRLIVGRLDDRLIGLAGLTVAGFWAISRDLRALGRLANATWTRLDARR